ncbi:GPI-anchored surface protein, putative [Bodo saltans]|uniref:GPI-anchored surface protein, putative n=1 Tax=Bodo saltans TaxID=75058 RepID=A0A0S4J2W5_BODSA|nr:GPI-anchored surface protein, putative [Bodo saltans]|eukprot:CUG06441.1 GPI-anchored surface protein, putative [Bodo saltans]
MAAVSLTPPHPPGYPLFVWLYHLTLQWLTRLLDVPPTAVCAGVSFTLVALGWTMMSHLAVASYEKQLGMPARICSRAAFVVMSHWCSPNSVRDLLTQTEVFSLHWFLSAMLVSSAACSGWFTFMFVAVLCGSNQHMSLFAVVPLAVACWWRCRPSVLRHVLLSGMVGCVALAAVYASMMWMSTSDVYAWGDLTTVPAILRHVLRMEYGSLRLHSGRGIHAVAEWRATNEVFWKWATERSPLAFVFLTLACIGSVVSFLGSKRSRIATSRAITAALLCWIATGSVIVFNSLINLPLSATHTITGALHCQVVGRLWSHLWIPLSLLAADGACWCGAWGGRWLNTPTSMGAVAAIVAAMISLMVVVEDATSVVPVEYLHQLRSLHDAYAESLLVSLPQNAIIVTTGDQPLTALRHAQRARGLRPDVIHIDRETSWYAWFHRKMGEPQYSRRISWPPSSGDGFVSVASLAHRNVPQRRLFVMEDKELAAEGVKIKETFVMRFGEDGWLYEIVPQLKDRCSRDACRVHGAPPLPRGLRRFACLVQNSHISWRWSDVSVFCHAQTTLPQSPSPDVFVLRNHVRLVGRRHPWEALVLQQYHLSVKHALLQAADAAQRCCSNRSTFAAALSNIRDEAHRRLLQEYFVDEETYDTSIVPFKALLNRTIAALAQL